MIKMNDDYDPDNANWAYISIPYNANNDYNANPFGMLPSDWNPDDAKISQCIDCHKKASGSDFVFVNGN